MKKVGIIRCQQTEDMCSGAACFKALKESKGAFQGIEISNIVGFVSCGGCPGKKIITRAKLMVERGAEVIALSTCISKGTPIGFPCPHTEQIKNVLAQKLDDNIQLLDFSH